MVDVQQSDIDIVEVFDVLFVQVVVFKDGIFGNCIVWSKDILFIDIYMIEEYFF